MYIYIAKHKDIGNIGGIINARDSVEAYTNTLKEVAKRGGNTKTIIFTSL